MTTTAETEAAELARWHHGSQSIPEWLASGPDPDKARAALVRALDRPRRGGAFSRALAAWLGADLDQVYAQSSTVPTTAKSRTADHEPEAPRSGRASAHRKRVEREVRHHRGGQGLEGSLQPGRREDTLSVRADAIGTAGT